MRALGGEATTWLRRVLVAEEERNAILFRHGHSTAYQACDRRTDGGHVNSLWPYGFSHFFRLPFARSSGEGIFSNGYSRQDARPITALA